MSNSPNHRCTEKTFLEFDDFHLDHTASSAFDFRDAGPPLDSGLTHLRMDNVVFEELDLDPKFRALAVAHPPHFSEAVHSTPRDGVKNSSLPSHSGPSGPDATVQSTRDAPKSAPAAPSVEVAPGTSAQSSRPLSAPAEPCYVAPSTHFVTKLSVGDIKARVEAELNKQSGVSYQFFDSKCRWEGVYLVGSARCKFEINVYKRASGGFVVEGNRLSGDSLAFVTIYKAIHNVFVPSSDATVIPSLPMPGGMEDASGRDVAESIDSVLAMASSGFCEAQLGASQIFCDIFTGSEETHLIHKYAECVAALMSLTDVQFESCNQHAVCALAHLSSSRSCQEVLMRDESFLRSLLLLCSDGSYDTIEMRRECARLLANLSSCGGEAGAQQVVASAGLQNVQSWLQSVDGLQDERLRLHADRARVSLLRSIGITS